MKLIVYEYAQDNLNKIYDYIAKDSIKYANETIDNIYLRISNLAYFPYIGRHIPEMNNKYYRELLYKSYRIFYEVSEKLGIIYIHAVIHGKRNFKSFHNF